MSSLIKIHIDTESEITKLRSLLYGHGISTISKPETQTSAYKQFRGIKEPILGVYIDSDQKAEAQAILKNFSKRLA